MTVYRPLPVVSTYEAADCNTCKWDNSNLYGDDPWDCCGIRIGNWLGFGPQYDEPTREEQSSGRCPSYTPTWWHRLMLAIGARPPLKRFIVETPALDACPVCRALPDQNCDAGLHS